MSDEQDVTSTEPMLDGIKVIVSHHRQVRNLILDYALGAAIIALIPISGIFLFKVIGLMLLLAKMMRDIGKQWGYPKGQDALAIAGNVFGGLGALSLAIMAWVTLFCLGLFIPFVASLAISASFFTLTWVLGQVTNQFYANSSQLDTQFLENTKDKLDR